LIWHSTATFSCHVSLTVLLSATQAPALVTASFWTICHEAAEMLLTGTVELLSVA
jgi:hypothetical protein